MRVMNKRADFMKNKRGLSRRNFLNQASLAFGSGIVGFSTSSFRMNSQEENSNIGRRINVATIDLKELQEYHTNEPSVKKVLVRMENIAGFKPDIICLPQLFNIRLVIEKKLLSEIAEDEKIPGPVTSQIAEFAKRHNCYVACPLCTKKEGHFYNSSILLDRKGNIAGVYHKIHPSKSEVIFPEPTLNHIGITPGALNQPVFETDFGNVGIQISDDVNWLDGWANLKKQCAEVILFSSDFQGGRMLNFYAWMNNCYIISSTAGDARVVDMSGNDLDSSSTFVRYAWAKINLEKVNTDTWPTNYRLPALFNKYGDRLSIKAWGNTEVITIESRDPQIRVKDVLKEFKIQTIDEVVETSRVIQDKYRL
jgi:beta-ureidopropionase